MHQELDVRGFPTKLNCVQRGCFSHAVQRHIRDVQDEKTRHPLPTDMGVFPTRNGR